MINSHSSKYISLFTFLLVLAISFPLTALAGWDPDNDSKQSGSKHSGSRSVDKAVSALKAKDPGLSKFFSKAYGYAVFPTVGKAGIGLGGAYGEGEVFRQGTYIGDSTLTQVSFGFQLGGQSFTEIIFFKDKKHLNDFTKGNFELGAQASAVALTAGVSADADYNNGVAIFTMPKQGLMYEAVIAGQKFSFDPK